MQPASELPALDTAAYLASHVRFAAGAWPLRAAEELRSALIFRALRGAALDCGFLAPWPARFRNAARDETRHARLCATVGARLGAPPPRYDDRPVHARLARLPDPLRRLSALLLVEVAMGETISLSLFRAGRRCAVEPLTRAALTAIAADEARHQRLGWSGIEALAPALSDEYRHALQLEASAALAAFEQQNAVPALDRLRRKVPFDPSLGALGVLAPQLRVEAFYTAVETLVLPRLDRLGLDGPSAWKHRYVGR